MEVNRLREQLHTVQLVPLTAFDASGNLNLEPMRQQIQRLFDAGIRVFIPCAGSSEFHTLECRRNRRRDSHDARGGRRSGTRDCSGRICS